MAGQWVASNDDRDILQEMRMVLRAHRVPGMDVEDVPSVGQVMRMATAGGTATTPYGTHIGTLTPGKAADLVLMDWGKIAYPYLDPETSVLDAVVQRGRSEALRPNSALTGRRVCAAARST
jgi:cytosine/adenosine deaminase-related metal-dependent hydrolase